MVMRLMRPMRPLRTALPTYNSRSARHPHVVQMAVSVATGAPISANRDVTVHSFGACGSKVLSVNKMNIDADVVCGMDVVFVNSGRRNAQGRPLITAGCAVPNKRARRSAAPGRSRRLTTPLSRRLERTHRAVALTGEIFGGDTTCFVRSASCSSLKISRSDREPDFANHCHRRRASVRFESSWLTDSFG